jgi:fructose-bisphosphate aldolase class II
MPLVSIVEQLRRGRREGYAVPLFDTFNMETTEGMFLALEETRAPGMIAIYSGLLERPNAPALAAYLRKRAESAPGPVALVLDHGQSFEHCMKAIQLGFTDVMYDGSRRPIEENIETTAAVVRAAHAVGVGVEAELGHVGSGKDYQEFGARRLGFTDPETVAPFVEQTGVDFLAVAFGSAHGVFQGRPQLDLELLEDIAGRVEIPLVMHGGSGLSEEQFRGAIERGVAKINIATDLFQEATRRVLGAARNGDATFFDFSRHVTEAVCERAAYHLRLFGAAGKQ